MNSILHTLYLLGIVVCLAACKATTQSDSSVKELQGTQDTQGVPAATGPDLYQSFNNALQEATRTFPNNACDCSLRQYRLRGVIETVVDCNQKNPIGQGPVRIAACNPGNVELPTLILETDPAYFQLVLSREGIFRVSFLSTKVPSNDPKRGGITHTDVPPRNQSSSGRRIPYVNEGLDEALKNLNAIMVSVGQVPPPLVKSLSALHKAFSAHIGVEISNSPNE
jgi:hypothetical protein